MKVIIKSFMCMISIYFTINTSMFSNGQTPMDRIRQQQYTAAMNSAHAYMRAGQIVPSGLIAILDPETASIASQHNQRVTQQQQQK